MKKINYNNLNQDVYTFTLPNGFRVYLIPYQDKKNYYAILATRYGSYDVCYKDSKGNLVKHHPGIAHFLEHKIFESDNATTPFAFFAKSGVNVNAATTFDNTRYYIWGTNDLKKNLNYLLDFVLSPYFTDENVSKEKRIIAEEIKMYDDNPEWVLDNTMRKNLFYDLPIKYDIAGTIQDINEITKEELYEAYNTFYNPSQMFLVLGGALDPKEIEELIKNHEKLNSKPKQKEISHLKYDEPADVKTEYKELKMNIKIPKIRYSIKINKNNFKDLKDIEINMYLGILASCLFGQTSLFKEKVTLQSLVSGFFIEKNFYGDYYTLDITAESDKADILIDEIDKTFNNIKVTKKDLERLKKVWIASEIKMIDNIELTVDNIYSDIVMYDKIYQDRIDIIKSLDIKKLNKFIKNLDFSNKSLVMALPNEEN